MTAETEISEALAIWSEATVRAEDVMQTVRPFLMACNPTNIAELLAVVKALQKDKERLDWLDRELACPLSLHDGRYINLSESGLRDVIDAAMKRTVTA